MKALIRLATLADRQWINKCALKQAAIFYPEFRPDKKRINQLIIDCISSPANYAMVIESDGELRGCLMAMVGPLPWAERRIARVLLWVSYVPMEGVRMLRKFRNWVDSRRGIKVAGLSSDFDWPDIRVSHLIERTGFPKAGASYMHFN